MFESNENVIPIVSEYLNRHMNDLQYGDISVIVKMKDGIATKIEMYCCSHLVTDRKKVKVSSVTNTENNPE